MDSGFHLHKVNGFLYLDIPSTNWPDSGSNCVDSRSHALEETGEDSLFSFKPDWKVNFLYTRSFQEFKHIQTGMYSHVRCLARRTTVTKVHQFTFVHQTSGIGVHLHVLEFLKWMSGVQKINFPVWKQMYAIFIKSMDSFIWNSITKRVDSRHWSLEDMSGVHTLHSSLGFKFN